MQRLLSTMAVRSFVVIGGLTLLAACSGQTRVAQVPASGVSGMNGGAEDTLYRDRAGQTHFQG